MKKVTSSSLFQILHFVLDSHYSKEEALEKAKKELVDILLANILNKSF